MSCRRLILSLAVGAVMVAGPTASGTQVLFLNPIGENHFVWSGGGLQNPVWLDVTQSAADQASAGPGGSSIAQGSDLDAGYSFLGGSHPDFDLVVEDVSGMGDVFLANVTVEPFDGFVPAGNELWAPVGNIYSDDYGSLLPEETTSYVGMRFWLGDGLHYGWVGVQRQGFDLEPWAWGYDTEVVPEPRMLVALTLAVGAASGRRRRGRRNTPRLST